MRLLSPLVQIVFSSAFLALTALAQVPPYVGQLLLQPTRSNEKCLTAASDSNGAQVTIQKCNSTISQSQKWTFTGGKVQVFADKCLEVPSVNATDGDKLQVSGCSNATTQQWNYDKWTNSLSLTNTSKCVDLSEGKLDDGNRIQIFSCAFGSPNQVWNTGFMSDQLPHTSQEEQFGSNNCSGLSTDSSDCQTAHISSANDFCLFAPPSKATVGDSEREAVVYCTKSGRGTRLIPNSTLLGVHFVKTAEYVQVTGVGDFTKINIPKGDSGGELDNRGADGKGNPIGGLVFGNSFGLDQQYHEWTTFISDKEFCFRACIGPNSTKYCNHVYDIMGCYWNMPANYDGGVYEDCLGDLAEPMGVYNQTSTFSQGLNSTPPAHPAPSSSSCQKLQTVGITPNSSTSI